MKKPLVIIDWVDSRRPCTSWQFLDDYEPMAPVRCRSVGWLIADGDTKALMQSVGDIEDPEAAQIMGILHIPAECVVNIETIKSE